MFLEAEQLLREIELEKISFQLKCKRGIIDEIDATDYITMLKKRESEIKEKLVGKYHVANDGAPRTITYRNDKELYTTFMPNRSRLSAKTKADLYDKILKYYGVHIDDMSLESVFKKALDEKARTENSDDDTIYTLNCDYKRYIDNKLAQKDIRKITGSDLQEYTQQLVNTKSVTDKDFKKYKTVLNLIFRYAVEYDIIAVNPVSKIKNSVYKKSLAVTENTPEKKIHSKSDIERIKSEVRRRMSRKRYKGYFINGYAVLLSIETGLRVGELCSLKWSDVKENYIHIHSQQLSKKGRNGKKGSTYYYAGYTKNEKGISQDGRKFPLTQAVKSILEELKALQDELHISSEYVFCHEDGEWIKTDAYLTCLRRLCISLNLDVTNNHAFRMSLNSNVFIPAGLPATERARLLGHSVETNLKYYSFAGKGNLQDICNLLNGIV